MEPWELGAREQVRETVASYAHFADAGRYDDFAALFTVDGILEVHGENVHRGRDEIRAFVGGVGAHLASTATVPIIRHHVSNLTIEMLAPGEARGACYFLAVTEHGVDHWGRYRDRYVGNGDVWRFGHRLVRTDGSTPGGWADSRLKR